MRKKEADQDDSGLSSLLAWKREREMEAERQRRAARWQNPPAALAARGYLPDESGEYIVTLRLSAEPMLLLLELAENVRQTPEDAAADAIILAGLGMQTLLEQRENQTKQRGGKR